MKIRKPIREIKKFYRIEDTFWHEGDTRSASQRFYERYGFNEFTEIEKIRQLEIKSLLTYPQ